MSYLIQKQHVIHTFFFYLFLSLLFLKFCFAPGWLIILLIFHCRNNFTWDQLDLISLAIYFSNNKILPSNSIMLRMFHMINSNRTALLHSLRPQDREKEKFKERGWWENLTRKGQSYLFADPFGQVSKFIWTLQDLPFQKRPPNKSYRIKNNVNSHWMLSSYFIWPSTFNWFSWNTCIGHPAEQMLPILGAGQAGFSE